MASHYQIHELQNGLRIRVVADMGRRERLVASTAVFALVGITASNLWSGRWWLALAAISALAVLTLKGTKCAELLATRLEFTMRGDFGRRITTSMVLFTADIRKLEFDAEPMVRGNGLYAATARSRWCLLPWLDYQRTMEVIDAIEKRFPGLAEGWHPERRAADRFLTLGLPGSFTGTSHGTRITSSGGLL